ncbi:MAG: hydrogenase maturation peptidase HycI [Candidatus Nezhaarchaeota archaeon]|nr:hydrogenase maturation peptidase HycI [Candidatus Nezhaarchaeota archaeon]
MWRKISKAIVDELVRETKRPSVVILCIGNKERGDDAFGPHVAKRIKRLRRRGLVEVIDCGTVPENYIGVIRRIKPTHVILVDAVDFKGSPGDIILSFEPKINELSISTHKPSLMLLTKYIQSTIGSKVILLGVQPKSIEWGLSMSDEVIEASNIVIKALRSVIRRIRRSTAEQGQTVSL